MFLIIITSLAQAGRLRRFQEVIDNDLACIEKGDTASPAFYFYGRAKLGVDTVSSIHSLHMKVILSL